MDHRRFGKGEDVAAHPAQLHFRDLHLDALRSQPEERVHDAARRLTGLTGQIGVEEIERNPHPEVRERLRIRGPGCHRRGRPAREDPEEDLDVPGAPGDGADVVQAPRQRGHAGPGNGAVGRLQAEDPVERRRNPDRAPGIGPDGAERGAGGHRHRGTGRRTARDARRIVRVPGPAEGGVVAADSEGEFLQVVLAEENGARLGERPPARSAPGRVVRELRPGGGGHPGHVHDVLHAQRDAEERPATVFPQSRGLPRARPRCRHPSGLGEGFLFPQVQKRPEIAHRPGAIQRLLDQLDRRNAPGRQVAARFGDGAGRAAGRQRRDPRRCRITRAPGRARHQVTGGQRLRRGRKPGEAAAGVLEFLPERARSFLRGGQACGHPEVSSISARQAPAPANGARRPAARTRRPPRSRGA